VELDQVKKVAKQLGPAVPIHLSGTASFSNHHTFAAQWQRAPSCWKQVLS